MLLCTIYADRQEGRRTSGPYSGIRKNQTVTAGLQRKSSGVHCCRAYGGTEMSINSKTAAVISYITWIGFIIALVIRDPSDRFTAHHMNQSLVLSIVGTLGGAIAIIPILGGMIAGIVSLAVFVFEVIGIYRAATGSMEPLPIIGDIHLIG